VKVGGRKTVTRRCGFGRRFGMGLVVAAAMLCVLLMAFEPGVKADVGASDGKGVAFGSAAVRTSQKYEARIVHPKGGAIVSGATYIQLKARPNIKILSVFIDDQYFTSGPPYTIPWNSATVTNGRHRITIAAATPALSSNALSPNSQLRLQTVQFTVHNKHRLLQGSPTPTPDPTATPTPASTPSPKPTSTPAPLPTATPTPASTPSPDPTSAPTPRPTATPAPASTPSPNPTPTPTPRPTATSTPSPSPTRTPTPTPTPTISPNCSIVTDVGPVITDTSGNSWAITLGTQVSVNGVADSTTNNVIELVYSAGLVYQENSSELWWYKSSPSDVWHSAPAPSCPGATPTPIPTSSPTPVPGGGGGPLSVTITGSPTVGPTTLTASFASVPVGGTPPYSYAWVWGDGTANGTTQNPNHNFTVAGTYTTTLTVTDSASHTASQVKTVLATGAAYYVAKSGNDSNNGTSPATPFLTLTKCQTAMRSGNKVCIINDSGTYTLGAQLTFTSTDNNEVWAAGFGQTPIVDGNNYAFNWNENSVSNMSVYGLTFQHMGPASGEGGTTHGAISVGSSGNKFRWNTILLDSGHVYSAFVSLYNGVSSTTIDSNTLNGGADTTGSIHAPSASFGVNFGGSQGSITLTHNLCENLQAGCANFSTGGTGQANNILEYNLVLNSIQNCDDCGYFYMYDTSNGGPSNTGPSTATGNVIEYNAIYSNTNPALFGHGIYLDQGMSHVAVKYNVIASYNAGTGGGLTGIHTISPQPDESCIIPGAGPNTIENNICEVAGITPSYADFYDCGGNATSWPFTGCSATNEDGTFFGHPNTQSLSVANTIDHNIVFTRMASAPIWPGGMWNLISGNATNPTINSNDYFSETATTFSPSSWNAQWTWRAGSGNFKDSSFVTTNPRFINPSLNNYQMTNPPPGWVTLPTNQGPVNSPFQSAGSAF
jgi:hypothetical protein